MHTNLIIASLIFTLSSVCLVSAQTDPCDPSNHRNIHKAGYRGTNCDSLDKNVCDKYMGDGWFRAQNYDEKLPRIMSTECVDNFKCGTEYPIWLNGTHPSMREGIVDRIACMAGTSTCCDKMYHIKVKNCSKFYVYFLRETDSCSQAYCFGQSVPCKELDPCNKGYHTELPQDETRSSSCKGSRNKHCDDKLKETWYRFKGSQNTRMPTKCAKAFSCGTTYPIWLNGTHPSLSDIVVDRKACVSGSRSCCEKTYPIKIRNCTSFMVYRLEKTTQCPERYCFGEEGECRELESSQRSSGGGSCGTECLAIIGSILFCLGLVCPVLIYQILKWNKNKGRKVDPGNSKPDYVVKMKS